MFTELDCFLGRSVAWHGVAWQAMSGVVWSVLLNEMALYDIRMT